LIAGRFTVEVRVLSRAFCDYFLLYSTSYNDPARKSNCPFRAPRVGRSVREPPRNASEYKTIELIALRLGDARLGECYLRLRTMGSSTPAAFGRNNGFRGCQRTPLVRELLAKKILVRVDRRRSDQDRPITRIEWTSRKLSFCRPSSKCPSGGSAPSMEARETSSEIQTLFHGHRRKHDGVAPASQQLSRAHIYRGYNFRGLDSVPAHRCKRRKFQHGEKS
jgi:hypothetical protein